MPDRYLGPYRSLSWCRYSLRHLLKISLIKRQHTLHNFALPTIVTNHVQAPVVTTYFSVR
ncbi:TPA: hypothetical protein GE393_24830 [Escherichia coli]|nr:hypothetical protein [Escherichia coli]